MVEAPFTLMTACFVRRQYALKSVAASRPNQGYGRRSGRCISENCCNISIVGRTDAPPTASRAGYFRGLLTAEKWPWTANHGAARKRILAAAPRPSAGGPLMAANRLNRPLPTYRIGWSRRCRMIYFARFSISVRNARTFAANFRYRRRLAASASIIIFPIFARLSQNRKQPTVSNTTSSTNARKIAVTISISCCL